MATSKSKPATRTSRTAATAARKPASTKPAPRKTKVAATPASGRSTVRKKTRPKAPPAAPSTTAKSSGGIAGKLLSWSDNLMGLAAPLTHASLALTKGSWGSPAKSVAIKGAALLLAQTRKSLGMTVSEVARAIDLKNPDLLDQAETGKAALPFEIILRLAAVLGRNDPLSFALKLTRAYNPGLWEKMEAIGVGRLVEHVGREREFVNIYRGSDAARKLTDAEFAAVLKLVNAAFELALTFKQGE